MDKSRLIKIIAASVAAVAVLAAGIYGVTRLTARDGGDSDDQSVPAGPSDAPDTDQRDPALPPEDGDSPGGVKDPDDRTPEDGEDKSPADGEGDETGEDEAPDEPEEEEKTPTELAIEAYREIVANPSRWTYSQDSMPTGEYSYALFMLKPDDPAPTLLVGEASRDYLIYARLFQYDPERETVIEPTETLQGGIAQVEGFRGGVLQAADGMGLLSFKIDRDKGDEEVYRVTLVNGTLDFEKIWSGKLEDEKPIEITGREIVWSDVSDLNRLLSWTEDDTHENNPILPEDGDRLVLIGTLGTYTYDQALALGKDGDAPDPEKKPEGEFDLIVLDRPVKVTISSGFEDSLTEGEAAVINVTGVEGLEDYAGKHIIFSVDPLETAWPNGESLPLTGLAVVNGDVHVIEALEK